MSLSAFPSYGFLNTTYKVFNSGRAPEILLRLEDGRSSVISTASSIFVDLPSLPAGEHTIEVLNGGAEGEVRAIHVVDGYRFGSGNFRFSYLPNGHRFGCIVASDRVHFVDVHSGQHFTENGCRYNRHIKLSDKLVAMIEDFSLAGSATVLKSEITVWDLEELRVVHRISDPVSILHSRADDYILYKREDTTVGWLRAGGKSGLPEVEVLSYNNIDNHFVNVMSELVLVEENEKVHIHSLSGSLIKRLPHSSSLAINKNGLVCHRLKDELKIIDLHSERSEVIQSSEVYLDEKTFFFLGANFPQEDVEAGILVKAKSFHEEKPEKCNIKEGGDFVTINYGNYPLIPFKTCDFVFGKDMLLTVEYRRLKELRSFKVNFGTGAYSEPQYHDKNASTKVLNGQKKLFNTSVGIMSSSALSALVILYSNMFSVGILEEKSGEKIQAWPLKRACFGSRKYIVTKKDSSYLVYREDVFGGNPLLSEIVIHNYSSFEHDGYLIYTNEPTTKLSSFRFLNLMTGSTATVTDRRALNIRCNSPQVKGVFALANGFLISLDSGEIVAQDALGLDVVSADGLVGAKLNSNRIEVGRVSGSNITWVESSIEFDGCTGADLAPLGDYLARKSGLDSYELLSLDDVEQRTFHSGRFIKFIEDNTIVVNEKDKGFTKRVINPGNLQEVSKMKFNYYQFSSPSGYLFTRLTYTTRHYNKATRQEVTLAEKAEIESKLLTNEGKQELFEQHKEYFHRVGISEMTLLNQMNVFDTVRYLQIHDHKGGGAEVALPPGMQYLNYVSFDYNDKFVAVVGKKFSGGFVLISRLVFDENQLLVNAEIIEHKKNRWATWTVAISKSDLVCCYDSKPQSYLRKIGAEDSTRDQVPFYPESDLAWKEMDNKSFLCFSPSGRFIALSNEGYDPISWGGKGHRRSNTVYIARATDLAVVDEFSAHGAPFSSKRALSYTSVGFSTDERRFMSHSTDGVTIVRNINFQ